MSAQATSGDFPGLRRFNVSGALLSAGAAVLFVGTLMYARLTTELGLPAQASERSAALADALALGSQKLALAGGCSFAGDGLLLAACLAFAMRSSRRRAEAECVGWSLMAVSVALALVFDSLLAAAFYPLAQDPDPHPFLAAKAWFDLLFAAGNAPFGVGLVLALSNLRFEPRGLSVGLAGFGALVGVVAVGSALGYLSGVFIAPLAIGLSVTFGCAVLAVFGALAPGDDVVPR